MSSIKRKIHIKRLLMPAPELLPDTFGALTKLTIIGSGRMLIERHNGIGEFLENGISVNCTDCMLRVEGNDIEVVAITPERIMLRGVISGINFVAEKR